MSDTQSKCFNCPANKTYTMLFDYLPADAVAIGLKNITDMYNWINNCTFIKGNDQSILELKVGETYEYTNGTKYTIECNRKENTQSWLFISWLLIRFGINPIRLCYADISPLPNENNIEVLKFKLSLGPPVIPTNGTYKYDTYSAECIKNVVFAWINQFKPSSGVYPNNPTDIENFLTQNGSQEFAKCTSFTSNIYSEIEYYPDIYINSIGKLRNIKIENYSQDDIIEHISNPQGFAGNSTPSTFFDYIFKYSLPFAFIGAISYACLSILQINPADIIVNKNVVILVDGYITLCGVIAFCAWYGIDIGKYSIFGIKISDWFSLGVVDLTLN